MANNKFKKVRCKSGIVGQQYRIQDGYSSFEEFEAFSDNYGLVKRLGYDSVEEAWTDNPIVECSTIPSDFRFVANRTSILELFDYEGTLDTIIESSNMPVDIYHKFRKATNQLQEWLLVTSKKIGLTDEEIKGHKKF